MFVEETAIAIFDSLASPDRIPKWEIQPESVKDVFGKLATVSETGGFKITHHYGSNQVRLVRGDGTVVIYESFTGKHRLNREYEIRKKYARSR